jgi:hypothetical protein
MKCSSPLTPTCSEPRAWVWNEELKPFLTTIGAKLYIQLGISDAEFISVFGSIHPNLIWYLNRKLAKSCALDWVIENESEKQSNTNTQSTMPTRGFKFVWSQSLVDSLDKSGLTVPSHLLKSIWILDDELEELLLVELLLDELPLVELLLVELPLVELLLVELPLVELLLVELPLVELLLVELPLVELLLVELLLEELEEPKKACDVEMGTDQRNPTEIEQPKSFFASCSARITSELPPISGGS